jgi:hypothetical protein
MIGVLFIPDPDPDFLPISVTGSSGQKGTESRIRIRKHCNFGGQDGFSPSRNFFRVRAIDIWNI